MTQYPGSIFESTSVFWVQRPKSHDLWRNKKKHKEKNERAQIRIAICKQARIRDEVRFAPLRVRACVKDRYMPHLFP